MILSKKQNVWSQQSGRTFRRPARHTGARTHVNNRLARAKCTWVGPRAKLPFSFPLSSTPSRRGSAPSQTAASLHASRILCKLCHWRRSATTGQRDVATLLYRPTRSTEKLQPPADGVGTVCKKIATPRQRQRRRSKLSEATGERTLLERPSFLLQPSPLFATTGAGFATSIAAELRPTMAVAFFLATVLGFFYYLRGILLHPSCQSYDGRLRRDDLPQP